jgi:predicted glycosyltransferase involved in capsule biosynthesis
MSLNLIVKPLLENNKLLTIPKSIFWDNDGSVINAIKNNYLSLIKFNPDIYNNKLPFLMGLWRNKFEEIRGYDEDFIGYAAEDEDLVNRFLNLGLNFKETDSKIVHLFHGKHTVGEHEINNPKWVYNYNLFKQRLGTIVRNKNKEWGLNV